MGHILNCITIQNTTVMHNGSTSLCSSIYISWFGKWCFYGDAIHEQEAFPAVAVLPVKIICVDPVSVTEAVPRIVVVSCK